MKPPTSSDLTHRDSRPRPSIRLAFSRPSGPRQSRALAALLYAASIEARRIDRLDLAKTLMVLAIKNYVPPTKDAQPATNRTPFDVGTPYEDPTIDDAILGF